MKDTENKIIELLQKLPSEGPNIDYKQIPYTKDKNNELIKDVIAMLNSEPAMDKDKVILFGVSDSKGLIGIVPELWRDDNEYQNIFDKIVPQPVDIRTGTVSLDNMMFGYFFISSLNNEWIYESKEFFAPPNNDKLSEKLLVFKGQAFTRRGSKNCPLFSKDRQRILDKKILMNPLEKHIITNLDGDEDFITKFSMLGACDGNNKNDVAKLSKMVGVSEAMAIEKLRKIYKNNPELLRYNKGVWKTENKYGLLIENAERLYDDHIDMFFTMAKEVFLVVDPTVYLWSKEENFDKHMLENGEEHYSKELYLGIAETIAILGNNENAFNNVSRNIIINQIYAFERSFFKTKDWKIYESSSACFRWFGEACPRVFLEQLSRLLREKDQAFLDFLLEKNRKYAARNYKYELGDIIANIAKVEEYFSSAMNILIKLAEVNESYLDVLVGIVLPWFPQTNASIAVRIGVFNGLANENEDLTWKALMKLMPGKTTVGSPVSKPKYLKVKNVPENISRDEYNTTTVGYIEIALELLNNKVDRICDIIEVIDNVSDSIREKIVLAINDNAKSLEYDDREKIWNGLKDFSLKHRKFADANWALSEDKIIEIDRLAESIMPDSNQAWFVRLFRKDQYSLIEESNEYDIGNSRLKEKQIDILKAKYSNAEIEELLKNIDVVENKEVFGERIAEFILDKDIKYIIDNYIDSCDELIEGIFRVVEIERTIKIIEEYDDHVKAKILSTYGLTPKVVEEVRMLKESSREEFWKRTKAWRMESNDSEIVSEVINNLNEVNRTENSIHILYMLLEDKKMELDTLLVINTLKNDATLVSSNNANAYYIQAIIRWLHEKHVDKEDMLSIEWKYIEILDGREGKVPKYTWNELSTNPDFYIRVLKILYGKEANNQNEEERRNNARKCYYLMYNWKVVPGIDSNGKVNSDVLDNWVIKVTEKSKELDIESMALSYFGQAAFHAPKDDSGFFIDKHVAKHLQDDETGHMRSGFMTESINSRGLHSIDPTGETEFTIESDYRKKATEADEAGYFRLAETLRLIADSYHEEGEMNIEYSKRYES